ncbi:sigma-54 interaction domain-containing protein [Fuchsiella alkaliacetigena]|uniref:sigma-54 interaction domain-containing protein n=1 Tax=Fuchsiella alkaliacetigena TaxID=957042 RepID=UPI002009EA13|nr:sigma 54-interacting transcriptional regulator [Fuchsiella alkaliacetigena]MCK8823722.1 sigma 54-interacting transcriptional regulator [Fuchsiella alkaliacetigena]
MPNLKEMQIFVQQVADAFAAVLDYEVAIIDDNLEVIAGTGRYREEIGIKYGPGSMTHRLISSSRRESLLVRNPKQSEICSDCVDKEDCPVWAVIMSPIIFREQVIGSISLMAFNGQQQMNLVNNSSKLITFLDKVSTFIGSTLGEKKIRNQMRVMADQFKAVINSVHEGIVAINAQGKITHINQSAQEILLIDSEYEGEHINTLFFGLELEDIFSGLEMLDSSKQYFERKINYRQGNREFKLLCNITLIKSETGIIGATISFRKLKEIKELANKIIAEDQETTFAKIKGTSNQMVKIKKKMKRVATTDSTILIQGESGTGKGMFAEAIHQESCRRDASFVNVNCAAIPQSLLEAELFGYEEGAFTGAKKGGKPGKFELADQGTIFLDEIGDMPLSFQVKLLKVIENKKIERVGGVAEIEVDVRIIAATNRNLEKMIKEGNFREDLFYRLNVIPVYIPPLRERQEDINLLLHFFLERYVDRLDKNIRGFTAGAKKQLLNYSWPGNVRELENCIEYAVNIATANYITKENLPERIVDCDLEIKSSSTVPTFDELKRQAIIKALQEYGTSSKAKEKAAAALGISRATLYRKLKEFEIDFSQFKTSSQS